MKRNESVYAFWMLLQVARAGSVTEAARVLNLKQPSVATQLKYLESRYGKLFTADRLGIHFNERGREVLNTAQIIVSALKRLEEAGSKDEVEGTLVLAATSHSSAYLLPARLAAFHSLYPQARVRLVVRRSDACQEQVVNGTAGIGVIGETVTAFPMLSIERVPWLKDRVRLYGSPNIANRNTGLGWAERLAGTQLFLREPGSSLREAAETVLRDWLRGIQELKGAEALREWVIQGLGVGLMPEAAVSREVEQGLLVPLELPDSEKVRSFFLIRQRASSYPLLFEVFWEFLRAS